MKINQTADYPVSEIAPDTYFISDYGISNCYLLEGGESALLIDCGTGTGDLLGAVRRITDKPLIVAVTHGHVDHAGGQGQFDRVYVPEGDAGPMYRFMTSLPVRAFFLAVTRDADGRKYPVRTPARYGRRPEIVPFGDGRVFELGGRAVTATAAPGHTRGSALFLDERTKTAFVGDDLCAAPWLFLPDAASVETWLESARAILSLFPEYSLRWGHGDGVLDRETAARAVARGEELLRERPRNTLFPRVAFFPSKDSPDGCIVYRTDRVHGRAGRTRGTRGI